MNLPVDLQSLVDIHDQPYAILDEGRRAVVVNRAFEETYRVDRAGIAGTPCHELMMNGDGTRPCGPDCDSCPFAETFSRQVARTTSCSYRDAEGRTHLLRARAYPIGGKSGRSYVGLLIERDAARHHPDANDKACPEARMLGSSAAYRAALDRLLAAANTDAPVLLLVYVQKFAAIF